MTAAKEIRKRFPINDFTIKQLQVLNPSCARAEFRSLGPLAQKFPNLVKDGIVQQLNDEWNAWLLMNYHLIIMECNR